MINQELIEEIGKYIDMYYTPEDKEVKSYKNKEFVFKRIIRFWREYTKRVLTLNDDLEDDSEDYFEEDYFEEDYDDEDEFIADNELQIPGRGKLEAFMKQLEETFSQRLLRMIDERGMADSEAYTKAYVDRRHFSKIRKDVNYVPSKKTVLAFTIALELSLDEAKDLLASAGFALSRSSKTDLIIAYFLQNRIYDMFKINDVLEAYGLTVF